MFRKHDTIIIAALKAAIDDPNFKGAVAHIVDAMEQQMRHSAETVKKAKRWLRTLSDIVLITAFIISWLIEVI